MEQLYIEVLYTIKYKVGLSSGQMSQYQEELYAYAQKAFKVTNEMHRRYLSIASEEKVSFSAYKISSRFRKAPMSKRAIKVMLRCRTIFPSVCRVLSVLPAFRSLFSGERSLLNACISEVK